MLYAVAEIIRMLAMRKVACLGVALRVQNVRAAFSTGEGAETPGPPRNHALS
jgi:hypothetical protein